MTKGFFTFPTVLPPKGTLKSSIYNKAGEPFCKECGLDKQSKWPKMDWSGKGEKGILVIGEASGYWEDTKGEQWVGDVGKFFRRKLNAAGINLDRDCFKINALSCKPPDNRNPKKKELQCCKPWVLKAIEETKPKHIWLTGGPALESFYMDTIGPTNATRWRGLHIPDQEFKVWIHPLFHASYAMRGEKKDQHLMSTYERDLDTALSYLNKPFPIRENDEDKVVILYKYDEVIAYLKYIRDEKIPIIFDYETTGIKPFKKGHKIYCIGIADDAGAVVFPFQRPGTWTNAQYGVIKDVWIQILEDPEIDKTCHNSGYELLWSIVRIGCRPQGLNWCTMVNAHLVDDRKKFCGLKFQTYINFGVKGYDDEIAPYLEGDEYNRIDEAPQSKLHKYCGLDCIYTRDLRKVQEKVFDRIPDLKPAAEFYTDTIQTFTRMSIRGFGCDEIYLEKEWDKLSTRMDRINNMLLDTPEAESFRKHQGRQIKLTSGPDLRLLLFTVLNLQSVKKTKKKEQASTDEEVLAKIGIPFTEKLLNVKKIKKVRDTYLAQFRRETTEGRIHTQFNLHIARSMRSSSSDPNLHNIPVRNEMAKKSTRTAIIPREGHRIVESDYDAMEVNIAGCYTEDPVWVEYCRDELKDMHRDEACEIFLLDQKQVTHDIRFYIKNQWVFPQLYRSWYKSCAPNLWDSMIENKLKTTDDVSLKEWLAYKGIETYDQFEQHCGKHEKEYWDKYKVTKKWQDKILADYLKKGYVTTYFGHRRYGYLTPNVVCNTPIQGTAAHCLLWSCNKIDRISIDESWETEMIGQVHDSMINDMYPPEQEMVVETIKQVAEKDIVDTYDWIIVPLTMEFEFTPINKSWYEKTKVTQNENGDFVDKKGRIYNLNY
jgi:uracil-DNA glycosylase family 4